MEHQGLCGKGFSGSGGGGDRGSPRAAARPSSNLPLSLIHRPSTPPCSPSLAELRVKTPISFSFKRGYLVQSGIPRSIPRVDHVIELVDTMVI